MSLRRTIYWLTVLIVTVLYVAVSADNSGACERAADTFPTDEWARGGISVLPPAYTCLFIGGDTRVALDLGGWVRWSTTIALPTLLAYGAMSFVVRRGRGRRVRAAAP